MERWARMLIRNASFASSYKSHYPCTAYAWSLAMTTLRSASLKVKRYFKWQVLMITNQSSFQRWQAFRQFKSHAVSITSHQSTRMEICIPGDAHRSNKTVDSSAMETSKESSSPNEWLLSRNTVSSKLLVVATILWPLLKRTNCLALAVMSRASVVSKKLRIWIDLWRSELWALANLLILSPRS